MKDNAMGYVSDVTTEIMNITRYYKSINNGQINNFDVIRSLARKTIYAQQLEERLKRKEALLFKILLPCKKCSGIGYYKTKSGAGETILVNCEDCNATGYVRNYEDKSEELETKINLFSTMIRDLLRALKEETNEDTFKVRKAVDTIGQYYLLQLMENMELRENLRRIKNE